MKNVINLEQKVRHTNLKTLADVQSLISEGGATKNEAQAIMEILTGTSTFAAACQANGLVQSNEKGEPEAIANTINRFRNRAATIFMDTFKTVTAPVIEAVNAEAEIQAAADAEKAQADALAAWEASGHVGRKPGQENRPKHEIALEKAHAEARREARESIGVSAQGRIAPELQEKFVTAFRKIYTKAIKDLSEKYEKINGEPEKIEKMVEKGVKLLKVEPAAQKAAKPKKDKAPKADVPVANEAVEPEPVV